MNKKILDKLDADRINDMFDRIGGVYNETADRLLAELDTVCFAAGLKHNSKKGNELYYLLHQRPVNFNKVTNFYYKTLLDLYDYRKGVNPTTAKKQKMPNASGKSKALKAPNILKLPNATGNQRP